ncbi:hypothetical protein NDU88_002926 [Pleurodeles waltl]|uniref:Uncharacterized protein n=1 Tax=Pleurodeles waltl TaxID=8319 RepID=A0AAV7KTH1_PLEWA|nr:hypothetical protein NDU88_002926 [Pleurodeles waltl]
MQRLARAETRRGRAPSTEPNGPVVAAAVPCEQLKTPGGQLGLIAEHAHGGAARLRSSHDRGRSCGAEQMKTKLFGNCCSITPNACMLKRDPADGEVRSPAKNVER